jgi:hypothetical protein
MFHVEHFAAAVWAVGLSQKVLAHPAAACFAAVHAPNRWNIALPLRTTTARACAN